MSLDAPTPAGADVGAALPREFVAAISDRYLLERPIGQGGMALVWLATRRLDGARVAVKVLRPSLAAALSELRFTQEIRIASSVSSEALVPLLDSGEGAGLPYYVMPFAEGGSLRERLAKDGQLRLADAVAIARRIAIGLSALHARGFVHRDIKPENILLSGNGEVFLADYGIAHALIRSTRESFSTTGIIVGTPSYMSPEHGSGGTVDARSDQYSLGCLLYELIAGAPPFQGGSSRSVLARHLSDPPPSLVVVRPTIPEALEAIVLRLLMKVPADRFDDAQTVVRALDALGDIGDGTAPRSRVAQPPRVRHRALRVAIATAVLGGVGTVGWNLRPVALDPDRVVVFPLTSVGAGRDPTIEQMPMLVGSALDRAAVTRWVDGHALLTSEEHQRGDVISRRRARGLAREERARYYVDGAVAVTGESTTVQLRLHDVRSGTQLDSESETGATGVALGDLVLRAVVRILPALTGLESVVDVSPMVGRDAAAVDSWLRGERAYRQSRMHESLRYLERAVGADSGLAPAAFRAAVAAGWIGRPERAKALIDLALRTTGSLPARDHAFALAFERFLSGRADEAIARLRPLLTRETESADAWMLAGEVYLHLLPTIAVDSQLTTMLPLLTDWPLESFAREAFESASRLDPAYSPPLPHLADMAARRGDVARLAELRQQIARTNPDSVLAQRLTTAERCLRTGPQGTDWKALARTGTSTLWHVGFMLRSSSVARGRACATAAFSAVLDADAVPGPEDWGSLVALHGMRGASGRDSAALYVVDSARMRDMPQAIGILVVGRSAGLDVGSRTEPFIEQLRANIASRRAPSLWLLTLEAAAAGDRAALDRVSGALQALRRAPGERLDSLIAEVADAYRARARGDTAEALRRFGALRPTAGTNDLLGSLWEALAPERMTYAELLLASGHAALAHRVASTFDQPEIIINELFLRRSLSLRARAAEVLGDSTLAARARARLAVLDSLPH